MPEPFRLPAAPPYKFRPIAAWDRPGKKARQIASFLIEIRVPSSAEVKTQ
jgi:hypothetical protein